MDDLFKQARQCLQERDPVRKVDMSLRVAELFQHYQGHLPVNARAWSCAPGRPDLPSLVHHSRLSHRKLNSQEGRGAFLHALAHIEFNAINLAWDAVCRFPGMPAAYYLDWSVVAREESLHFRLLAQRLVEIGYHYGSFTAHDGLWEMAERTAHDVLVRMALVPRVLEARGLDVTPGMLQRLEKIGDYASVRILERILEDEIGHVETGSRWFEYLCRQRGLDPVATFSGLMTDAGIYHVRKPLNITARRMAGFTEPELELLQHWSEQKQ